MPQYRYRALFLLLCGFMAVFLQFAHVLKMNPIHDSESTEHIQLHLDEVEHQHAESETLDENELALLKIHDFMHANMGFYIGSAIQAPLLVAVIGMVQFQSVPEFPSLQHPPPVPPPLA